MTTNLQNLRKSQHALAKTIYAAWKEGTDVKNRHAICDENGEFLIGSLGYPYGKLYVAAKHAKKYPLATPYFDFPTLTIADYPSNRYSTAWCAIVSRGLDGRPSYDFKGFFAGGQVHIKCPLPCLIAHAQRDNRKGYGTKSFVFIDKDGTQTPTTPMKGLKLLEEALKNA